MKYKVCILAAGVGSRMGALSHHVNKGVLPINFKAVISHIIEKFSKDVEIVIAVGHKKESIKEYIDIAHSNRKINFVNIDKYAGPGTGPGYSLLKCKKYLNCPFVFFAADTIVLEEIPEPSKNWFGIAPVKDTENYCTVKIKKNLVYEIDDKIKTNNKFAFIGLAGVFDYKSFFTALETNKEPISGEIQVSNGFKSLLEKKLEPIGFTWFDTGTLENYIETNKNLSGAEKKFDFSKGNEFLYFVNGKVIKYFSDSNITRQRCERAEILKALSPKIDMSSAHFYSYLKLDGQVLYNILNNQVFSQFLNWISKNLWVKQKLNDSKKEKFYKACKSFYYDKTIKRLDMFYNKTGVVDCKNQINGIEVTDLKQMFSKIDWELFYNGIPTTIHGDLQFDNILVQTAVNDKFEKFKLLDWRQNFGGLIESGDLYYDLSKLYGGMVLSYQLIKDGKFSFEMSGNNVYYNYMIKNDLVEAREMYEEFIFKSGYDLRKIKLMTGLIFLNMSPLHHDPFDHFLYFLGKSMISRNISN